ncbi:MAG: M24 family metallopeptidase [Chloroflexi bacterium]|nr:M24 family metallopeptidase [Chloroflexota bacterium]
MLKRLEGVRRALAEQNLDALLVAQSEEAPSPHVRYLSGFGGSKAVLIITPQRQIIASDSRYWDQIGKQCPDFELVKLTLKPDETLRDTLRALGVRRAGFESRRLTVDQQAEWAKAFESVELVATKDVVESLRMIKDDQEIETLRRALALTDQAYEYIVNWIEPGMSEKEVAWELESFMRTHGADGLAFDVHVASGPGSAEPHHVSDTRPIALGEPIWIDMGARVGGYCADLTRSFTLGEPDAQFKRIYMIVLQAQLAVERALKAGLPGKEADAIARKVIEDAGYGANFGHGLGHGLGLAVHEKPSAGRASEDTLVSGAVVTVEPGIYIPGWGGVRIEDVALIRDDDAEVLTRASKMAV